MKPFEHLYERGFTSAQRVSLITWWLCTGEKLSPSEIAQRLGISRQAAHRLMEDASAAIPVVIIATRWQLADFAYPDMPYSATPPTQGRAVCAGSA